MPASKYFCDWCDKGNEDFGVDILLSREETGAYICNECVAFAVARIDEERRERADNLQDIRENGTWPSSARLRR